MEPPFLSVSSGSSWVEASSKPPTRFRFSFPFSLPSPASPSPIGKRAAARRSEHDDEAHVGQQGMEHVVALRCALVTASSPTAPGTGSGSL